MSAPVAQTYEGKRKESNRYKLVKKLIELSYTVDDAEAEDRIYFDIRQALPQVDQYSSSCLEVLDQLVNHGPLFDGDVVSKAGRDLLLEFGLAVKCVCKGEQGYQAATYLGWSVYKAKEATDNKAYPVDAANRLRHVNEGANA